MSWLSQQGGTFTVNGRMTLRGDWVAQKPFGNIIPGYYFLQGGVASMNALDLQTYGEVYQETGTTNCVAGDITIGNTNSTHGVYSLRGGTLVCSNLTIAGSWGINYFQNQGGTHVVRGVLNIIGLPPPYDSNYYELDGGQLTASEIRLTNYAYFTCRGGSILGSPKLSIWQSTWSSGPGITHFGSLEGNPTIQFPADPCTLTFSNSSSSSIAFATIRGWNGSRSGGGQHQILFPPAGLSEQQLTNIYFAYPNGATGMFFGLWPATLLPTGELVPAQQLLRAERTGADLVLTWPFPIPLQTATNVAGPFTTITNSYSPFTNHLLDPQRFFRLNL